MHPDCVKAFVTEFHKEMNRLAATKDTERDRLTCDLTKTNGDTGGENLTKIDQRITRDMEKYVDGPAREKIKEAREGFTLWLAALASVRDGAFDKKEQDVTRRLVGGEKLEKLLQFYSGCSRNEVEKITCEKLMYAASLYERIAPREFLIKFDEIQNDISNKFQQRDFPSFLSKLMNAAQ